MHSISRRSLLLSGLTVSAASAFERIALAKAIGHKTSSDSHVLVDAESFSSLGGWVVDSQFVDQMGAPFLLAHGMGVPVEDAQTEATIPMAGDYRVWVRTRDWVAPWNAPGAPGQFKVKLNGRSLDATFGTDGTKWHWQDGGRVYLAAGKITVTLHDLTGFDGRCDAILLTSDTSFRPPEDGPELAAFRKRAIGVPAEVEELEPFDFVVAGGGMAGTAAAVTAARRGLKVALIQDRRVLGGNGSSEVRVALGGKIHLPPYPSLGNLVAELDPGYPGNAQPAANYGDDLKLAVARAEKNLHLFLQTRVIAVEKAESRIVSITARDLTTRREMRFRAPLFADCTGDACVGYLAGANLRYGRESRSETGEALAPTVADNFVNGTTLMWYSEETKAHEPFPETPWALQFDEKSVQNALRGDWDWETGQNRDQIADAERIRDGAFRAIYGNWSFQKRHDSLKAKYENHRLAWVPYVAGKRESRRLMGDVVLRQQDVVEQRAFPDGCVTATWPIDLHHPQEQNTAEFPGEEFRTVASFGNKQPYAIPYRCLYSNNIDNLFMAGRNISVTHVALGTVRVMRTTGMMGEVVGMAAAIAKRHGTSPRGVYRDCLSELQDAMRAGVSRATAETKNDTPRVARQINA